MVTRARISSTLGMYGTRFGAQIVRQYEDDVGTLGAGGSAAPLRYPLPPAGEGHLLPSPACGAGTGRGAGSTGGGGLSGVTRAGGARRPGCPKSAFLALHAATICASSCGSGLVALRGCAMPSMIGLMQSTWMPSPFRAPPWTTPASRQAAAICRHGPYACP